MQTRTKRMKELRWRARASVAVAACVAWGAGAATHIYTPVSSTDAWSGGNHWDATPASAASTVLAMASNNAAVLPNAVVNANNNDVANPFDLNRLRLQGTGPVSGAGTVTLGGSALRLVSNAGTAPTVSLSALAGTAGLTYTLTTPLTLSANTLFAGDGTATFRLDGALGGTGGLIKDGTSTLQLNADSSASYDGDITIRGGVVRLNANLNSSKLPDATTVTFGGAGGVFIYGNATGGGNYSQTLGGVAFVTGAGSVEVNRPGGGNTYLTIAAGGVSRAVGAIGGLTVTGGSNPGNAKVALVGQSAGFLSQGLFFGNEYLFYDATGYTRAINYASDSVAYATSGNQATLATTGKHTQFSGAAGATTTASGAGAGTSLTLADATSFSVGQTLSGTGIQKGTYIVAKAGNTLTLSQNNTVANGAVITPYAGINAQTGASINTLKFAGTVGSLRLADSQTLTLADGGILFNLNSSVASILSGGTGIQTAANGEFVLNSAASINCWIVVGTPLLANGTNPMTKAGIGVVRMEAANTYAGSSYLLGGSLDAAIAEVPGVSGPLGASGAIHFYGGALRHTAANTYDYSGRFSTASYQVFNVDPNGQTVTLASALASSGGRLIVNHATGVLVLSGNSSFDGGTTFSGAGTLVIGSDAALGSGPLAYTGTGVLRATDNTTRTLSNPLFLSGGAKTIGVNNASQLGSLVFTGPVTLGADATLTVKSAGTVSGCALVLEGAVGDDGAVRALSVGGASTDCLGCLFLLGSNTYGGQTSIGTSGAVGPVVVNTLANDGETFSSLGAPSGANRVIRMATASSGAGILRYIGGPASTDRGISFGFVGTATSPNTATLDASGTGALTWDADVTCSGGATSTGAKNFIVDGTSEGANTFAGTIPNPAAGTGLLNLTKRGRGTWVVNGPNTFTGGLTVSAGTLVLDHANNVSVIAAANTLSLGGGTLSVKGKSSGSTALALGNVTVTDETGLSIIQVVQNGGAGTAVTLGTITVNPITYYGSSDLLFDLLGASASSIKIGTAISATPGASTVNGRLVIRTAAGQTDFVHNNNDINSAIAAVNAVTTIGAANGNDKTDYVVTNTATIGAGSSGTAISTRSLRIAPTLNNQTLTIANANAVAPGATAGLRVAGSGLVFDGGAYDFTIAAAEGGFAPIAANNSGNNEISIHHFGAGTLTIASNVYLGRHAADGLTFNGTGLVDLQGRVTGSESSGRPAFIINGAVLRVSGTTESITLDATATGAGCAPILLNCGGVLELASGIDLTRKVGPSAGVADAGNIQWKGDGGFSAFGGDRAVRLNNGTVSIAWDSANFVPANGALILSSRYADSTLDFQNDLDFANQQRVVDVRNGSAAVDARLSGVLAGRYGGGLIKRGSGTLEVTRANTYEGDTWVQAGELRVKGTTGGGLVTVFDGAAISGTGTVARLTLAAGASLKVRATGGGTPAMLTVSDVAAIADGTLDLSGLGAVAAGDHVLIQGDSISGAEFASVVGLPANRRVLVTDTAVILKGAAAGTAIVLR